MKGFRPNGISASTGIPDGDGELNSASCAACGGSDTVILYIGREAPVGPRPRRPDGARATPRTVAALTPRAGEGEKRSRNRISRPPRGRPPPRKEKSAPPPRC